MARGSVVDESRMTTATILVTPHQGYLDYEQLQNSSPEVYQYRHKRETTSSQPGRQDALLCSDQGRAKNQQSTSHQSFK